jgi:uncharacterized protein
VHIDTVLLKVASRCNLDCSYCYVYHLGDDSWRSQPKLMSGDVARRVASQLADLKSAQGRSFSVVLHGGEPLMLGSERLDALLAVLRGQLGSECGISIQTNGVLITDAILDVCHAYDTRLSVSVDGPEELHDRYRGDVRGRPTHARVMRGIERLKAHPHATELFSGVLAVVDPSFPANEVYGFFQKLEVPSVDFLYRDGNHTSLPPGKVSVDSQAYGRWMAAIFDHYVRDPAPMRIRILDDIVKLLLGSTGVKEGVGLTDYGILVIDSDGSVKKNDTLKSSPPGDRFVQPWSVATHSLAEIAASDEFNVYHLAQKPTAAACLACPLLKICGGGMVTHRYKAGSGYDNPTVFCADQQYLIGAIKRYLAGYSGTLEMVA